MKSGNSVVSWFLAGASLVGGIAFAAQFSGVPNEFRAESQVSAAAMNANFEALAAYVNVLNDRIDALASESGGEICGATGGNFSGAMGGYAGARVQCSSVSTCGSTAHMCSAHELTRAVSLGQAVPKQGWYASGIRVDADEVINDCQGYTSSDSGMQGRVWSPATGPQTNLCESSNTPILCCN